MIVSTHSGEILILELKVPFNEKNISVKLKLASFGPPSSFITSFVFLDESLLVVGFSNGQICLANFIISNGDLSFQKISDFSLSSDLRSVQSLHYFATDFKEGFLALKKGVILFYFN